MTPDLTIDPPREDHVEWVELSAKAEHHLLRGGRWLRAHPGHGR